MEKIGGSDYIIYKVFHSEKGHWVNICMTEQKIFKMFKYDKVLIMVWNLHKLVREKDNCIVPNYIPAHELHRYFFFILVSNLRCYFPVIFIVLLPSFFFLSKTPNFTFQSPKPQKTYHVHRVGSLPPTCFF